MLMARNMPNVYDRDNDDHCHIPNGNVSEDSDFDSDEEDAVYTGPLFDKLGSPIKPPPADIPTDMTDIWDCLGPSVEDIYDNPHEEGDVPASNDQTQDAGRSPPIGNRFTF